MTALDNSPAEKPKQEERYVVKIDTDMIVYTGRGRCVAWDRKKRERCEYGVPMFDQFEAGGWRNVYVPGRGNVWVGLILEEAYLSALEQRCFKHVDEPGPNLAPLDWEWFDPDKHADLLKPHTGIWVRDHTLTPPAREVRPDYVPPRGRRSVLKPGGAESEMTALYRWYDCDGLLLYIGITGDLATRQATHAKKSAWSEFAASSTVERFPTRAAAENAERAAIEAENPLFNAARSNPSAAGSRLVDYLVKHGREDLIRPDVSRG